MTHRFVVIGIVLQTIAIAFFIATLVSLYNTAKALEVDSTILAAQSLLSVMKWGAISVGAHFAGATLMWVHRYKNVQASYEMESLPLA